MNSETLLILAAVGYLIASVFYGALLFKQHVNNRPSWLLLSRFAGGGGLLAHTAAIGLHCVTTHHSPITTTAETLSALGWAIAGVYVLTEIVQYKHPPTALGAFAFPLAFLALFSGANISAMSDHSASVAAQLDNQLVSLHVLAILGAYAMLTLAVCCGALYMIENRMLKRKEVAGGLFCRLPPLATVDHLAFTLVSLAFSLLTLGLVAGEIRAVSGHLPLIDARTALAVLSWAIFGGYLLLHSSRLAIGVRANYILFAGLFVAMLTFFAPSTIHHFS